MYVPDAASDLLAISQHHENGEPFLLFLALIDHDDTRETIGAQGLVELLEPLAYLELSKLGAALREYAANPNAVKAWIETI